MHPLFAGRYNIVIDGIKKKNLKFGLFFVLHKGQTIDTMVFRPV